MREPPASPGAVRAHDTPVGRLAASNAHFLRQGAELVGRLSDEQFRFAPPADPRLATSPALFARGGIGAHFRHVLDHYASFLEGLNGGVVDYDVRARDRALEQDRGQCRGRLGDVIDALEALARRGSDEALLTATHGSKPAEASGAGAAWAARSSLSRELVFLASHTVHHYALIAVIARLFGVEPGDDFGVAPSTLAFERAAASCAR